MKKAFSNRLPAILTAALLLCGGVFAVSAQASEWATFEEADRVYHEAILEGVAIEKRVAELKTATGGSALERTQRLHLASLLQWRHGYVKAALSTLDGALALERSGSLLRRRGQLLEAVDRNDEAIESYRDALPLLSGSSRADTELRMALLIASEQGEIEPLLTLAEGGDAAVRNRVAMVLAVLGQAGEAARLYDVPADAPADRRWRQALRLTEWSLWAGESLNAREAAWRAVDLAGTEQDRRYAVALLTEAYRQAEALPALVEALENGREVGGDSRALWIGLLREIDRPEDALAALEGSAEHEAPAVKRQFVGIYRESGRSAEMVAELKRLMAVDPDEVIWAQGLAEFYLERGELSEAEAAWRGFVDRAEAAPALLDGAAVILKLGFDELALAAAAKAQRKTVVNRAGRDAALDRAGRFRFELYMRRDRLDEAREVLESLEAATAASDPMRQSIAMAYERLNLPAEALRVMQALVEARDSSDDEANVEASQYLAQLLIANGEPQRAVDLLLAALPDASASQLRLLYTRLIAAARAAGIDDALVADLTAKLDAGRAAQYETQFLIEMHTRARNEVEALALIDTIYGKAGADPIARLQQVAVLHRSLGNWQTYDDTLAELTEQDAENAVFHVRSRIINYIDRLRFEAEDEQEVSDTLIALLEQYLAVSEVGADREFVAGVLAMGGQRQQAIGLYREILAVDPSRLDSYLEIGNQLTYLQQEDRAVGMYQYLLASSDREEVSWVALDGILNMQPARETLEWARRTALLRLSAVPEQFEYYRQLADLSLDLGDNERQLATLYNGLAAGAELRLATLRELLRVTDGTATGSVVFNQGTGIQFSGLPSGFTISGLPSGFGVAGEGGEWQERHVDFSRRLQALGLALPPGVHFSLGKALIEAGDTDAALRAVSQAVERTGSDALLVQAAGIFQQAGDDLSAHRLFERALRNDPGNFDLLADVVRSNERVGNQARAGELFLAGLRTLLTRQPLQREEILLVSGLTLPPEVPDKDELDSVSLIAGKELFPYFDRRGYTHSMEYRRYYTLLRNGLVRMLLSDPSQRSAAFAGLEEDYAATLAFVRARQSAVPDSNQFPPRPTGLPRLANYPRLQLQAQLMRYLAYWSGDYAAANELDETLLTLFPEDAQLPEILVAHRAEWGSPAYLDWLEHDAALASGQKEALRRHWLALATDNDEGLLAVRTIAREVAAPGGEAALQEALDRALQTGDAAATVRAVKQLADTDSIWEALARVEPYLSAADRKAVADHVVAILRNDTAQAANSLRIPMSLSSPNRYRLENRPRPWAARLQDWLGEAVFDDDRLLALAIESEKTSSQVGLVDPWFIYSALSDANRDKWIGRLLTQSMDMALDLLMLLLQVECDDATVERLRTIVRDFEGNNLHVFPDTYLPLERIDIHPANVPLARELEAVVRKRFPDVFLERQPDPVSEPNYLRSEGKIEEALHKLVDLYLNGKLPSSNPDGRDANRFVRGYYPQLVAGNESTLIDILKNRDLSSPEEIRRRNRLLLRLYLHSHRYEGDPRRLLSVVLGLLETGPGTPELLQWVSRLRELAGQRFAAQELRRTQLEDIERAGADASLPLVLRASLRGAMALDHPIDAVVYAEALGLGAPVPPAETPADEQQPSGTLDAVVRALQGEDFVRLRRELELLWQHLRLGEWSGWEDAAGVIELDDVVRMPMHRDQAAAASLQKPEGGGESMLSALAAHPLGVEILETWVATVRGRLLEQAQPLIDALADAHVHKGTAADRFAELGAAIRERRAGDREIGLWLAIGSRVPELAASDEAGAALASYMSLETTYRPTLLFGLTKSLAQRGDADGALRGYQSLIHWLHGRPPPASSDPVADWSINFVLSDAREKLDAATYRRLLRDVFDRVRPREDFLLPAYDDFVLSQFDAAGDREAFYRAFEADVDAAMPTLRGAASDRGLESDSGLDDLFRPVFAAAAAVMEYRRGDTRMALDGLQQAMEARVLLRNTVLGNDSSLGTGGFSTVGGGRPAFAGFADRRQQERENRYRDTLGKETSITLGRSSLMREFASAMMTYKADSDLPSLLFSEVSSDDLQQMRDTIRGRIETGGIERNLGIEMLLGVVRAYRERGADAEAQRALADVEAQLANDDVTLRTAAAVAVAAGELGRGLNDTRLEKELLLEGAIEPRYMAAVLRRIAASEGEAAALDVGSSLLEFTLDDALMDELIGLADANGNPAQAEEWRALQREARLARAELDRTEALARVF